MSNYTIHGADLQFVEIELDPEQSIVAENGSMMYMEDGIEMDTRLGDGSAKHSGFLGSLIGAGKRALTGEKAFLGFFTNKGNQTAKLAFAAPHPGMIVPINLAELGGVIYCQKRAFLCAAKGVSINIGFTRKLGAGFFGGHGFILQKLQGETVVFIHAGGAIIEKNLEQNQKIRVDTGSIVGFQGSVTFNIEVVTGFKNIFFGGEQLFLSTLTGPGKIWIQSLPYPRLVNNIWDSILVMEQKKRQ